MLFGFVSSFRVNLAIPGPQVWSKFACSIELCPCKVSSKPDLTQPSYGRNKVCPSQKSQKSFTKSQKSYPESSESQKSFPNSAKPYPELPTSPTSYPASHASRSNSRESDQHNKHPIPNHKYHIFNQMRVEMIPNGFVSY